MDWTEAEARLATLEREVSRHQRLAREQQALARDDGRGAALGHDSGHERWRGHGGWLGRGHWRSPPHGAGRTIVFLWGKRQELHPIMQNLEALP